MHSNLINQLEVLRKRTARFRKVILHLHSPYSWDWAKGSVDKVKNAREQFLEKDGEHFFLKNIQPHFELVGITDHMKCSYSCKLSNVTKPEDDCVVLPGMEVNFKPDGALGIIRIHLTIILPEYSTPEDFAKLFHTQNSIPSDDKRTGQEEITGIQLKDFVKDVTKQNGICIAAHVDNQQGIRNCFRQTAIETMKMFSIDEVTKLETENNIGDCLKEYLFDSGIHAVEISSSALAGHYQWNSIIDGKVKWIPTILTSDVHCIEDLDRPSRTTHIKMTTRSLQGLKDALSFPETRIRYPVNLPTLPNPRLQGIHITGGKDSFFENLTVAFAENLNCLIGVRGSGKSTLVEALRYAFGYNETLSELGKPLENSIREIQQANLKGSTIKVIYRTAHAENRLLQATYDPKEDYTTKVYTAAGDFLDVPNVEISGDYPLRLYGWSEIETLGREPSRQRDLLDRLIPELLPILKRRDCIRQELITNRAVINHCIADVNAAFSASDGNIRRYTEYKFDFDKLNTEDVKTIFSALDFANGQKNILKVLSKNAVSAIEKIKESYSITFKTDLESLIETANQELKEWWHAQEIKRLNISATEQNVQKALKIAVENIESFISLCNKSIEEIDTKSNALEHELRNKFSENDSMQKIADLRANADKRLKTVNNLRLNYQKKWNELIEALKKQKEITTRLEQIQNEIAGVRSKKNALIEQTLNQFLPKDMKVTIDFKAGKDTTEFASKLYAIFGAKSNQAKKISKIIETHATPVSFATMMGKKDFKELTGKTIITDSETLTFDEKDIDFCIAKTSPYEKDSSSDLTILIDNGKRLEMILNVQETKWDDRETILLNGGPVNEKSPGQRSSAMLPLIALAEDTPLVIDQPEDNLDKRVISQVLMQVLAKLKEHRQIIVCTHDPNILVGGDAEQVVVLEAESDKKGKVRVHGSIDNDDIVQTVINLLEGGAEAFDARRKRYRERIAG